MSRNIEPRGGSRGPCAHDGFHSGLGHYARESGELRYVMICDQCGQELRLVSAQPYRPEFRPGGRPQPAT